MDARLEAYFSERRATPTPNNVLILMLFTAEHARERQVVRVTEHSSDQRHTTSWVMYDLLHQTFHATVPPLT